MARTGFQYAYGPKHIVEYGAKASETFARGDAVCMDDTTGYVRIATATDAQILGVALDSVSSATAGDPVRVSIGPDTVYRATCSGTLSQGLLGEGLDIEGATGAMYVNEDSATYKVFMILSAPNGVGAGVEVLGKFIHSEAASGHTVLSSDLGADCISGAKIADDSVDSEHLAAAGIDAEHLAAAIAGNGLGGGAGSALSVTVDDSTIEINTDTLRLKDGGTTAAKLNADALAATKVPDYVEGTEHVGLFVSKTLTATAGTYTICTATFKFKVVLWWIRKLDTTASNVKLNNGTNDISANVASGTTDHALVMGGTIDNTYEDIAASGTLKAITDGNSAMTVCAIIVPTA